MGRAGALGTSPEHVRPVDGVNDDQVVTEKLERSPRSTACEVLGECRPSGWVLQKLGNGRGPAHAPAPEAP